MQLYINALAGNLLRGLMLVLFLCLPLSVSRALAEEAALSNDDPSVFEGDDGLGDDSNEPLEIDEESEENAPLPEKKDASESAPQPAADSGGALLENAPVEGPAAPPEGAPVEADHAILALDTVVMQEAATAEFDNYIQENEGGQNAFVQALTAGTQEATLLSMGGETENAEGLAKGEGPMTGMNSSIAAVQTIMSSEFLNSVQMPAGQQFDMAEVQGNFEKLAATFESFMTSASELQPGGVMEPGSMPMINPADMANLVTAAFSNMSVEQFSGNMDKMLDMRAAVFEGNMDTQNFNGPMPAFAGMEGSFNGPMVPMVMGGPEGLVFAPGTMPGFENPAGNFFEGPGIPGADNSFFNSLSADFADIAKAINDGNITEAQALLATVFGDLKGEAAFAYFNAFLSAFEGSITQAQKDGIVNTGTPLVLASVSVAGEGGTIHAHDVSIQRDPVDLAAVRAVVDRFEVHRDGQDIPLQVPNDGKTYLDLDANG